MPCTCKAYTFPHRPGSGFCEDPGEEPDECSDCPNHVETRDPYSTGDHWYSIIECELTNCPWGKE